MQWLKSCRCAESLEGRMIKREWRKSEASAQWFKRNDDGIGQITTRISYTLVLSYSPPSQTVLVQFFSNLSPSKNPNMGNQEMVNKCPPISPKVGYACYVTSQRPNALNKWMFFTIIVANWQTAIVAKPSFMYRDFWDYRWDNHDRVNVHLCGEFAWREILDEICLWRKKLKSLCMFGNSYRFQFYSKQCLRQYKNIQDEDTDIWGIMFKPVPSIS